MPYFIDQISNFIFFPFVSNALSKKHLSDLTWFIAPLATGA